MSSHDSFVNINNVTDLEYLRISALHCIPTRRLQYIQMLHQQLHGWCTFLTAAQMFHRSVARLPSSNLLEKLR